METKKHLVYKEDVLAMEWLADECEVVTALDVERMPTVDAVEVAHGRWNEKQEQIPWCEDDVDTYWMCSVCGAIEIGKTNYCHNCGAKMDGDGNG